jgi:glycosyltransferase involved in cell wall biosynthesis
MRVGFFSPLPPERSGIADYTFELLEYLREHVDVTAVVADNHLGTAVAPDGVDIVGASAVHSRSFDCNVYQMGNNSKYHRFVYENALETPGLLVMHDPSLADFHAEICCGTSVIFQDEVVYDSPTTDPIYLPRVEIGRGLRDLDRMEVLLARRIVEGSLRTLLNSGAMAEEFSRRYPDSDVGSLRLPAQVVLPRVGGGRPKIGDPIRIGVFGGINYYKRIRSAVDAFVRLHAEFADAQLVIAGRVDDPKFEREVRGEVARSGLDGSVEFLTDLTLDGLEQEMARCDVAIQLRWPTAGEMSATLMRTFGAGRPAVVTDVEQFRDLDEAFCWRVPHDDVVEVDALFEVMCRVAVDPPAAWDAGQLARSFVATEATYEKVAMEYVRHIDECREIQTRRPTHPPLSSAAPRPGVNVVRIAGGRRETHEAADALIDLLEAAGVDAVPVTVEMPRRTPDPPSQRPRKMPRLEWPPADREAAQRFVSGWAATRGPYPIDVVVSDEAFAATLFEYAVSELHRERIMVGYVAPFAMPIPFQMLPFLAELDELWTPSTFGVDVLQSLMPTEVLHVPLQPLSPTVERARMTGSTAFCCVVDGSGGIGRANAWDVLEAFVTVRQQVAVSVELGIIVHGELDRAARRRLEIAAERVGASIIDTTAVDERREAISEFDVLVAVHHGDPYGLATWDAFVAGLEVIVCDGFGLPGRIARSTVVSARPIRVARGDLYLDPDSQDRMNDGQEWAGVNRNEIARRMIEHTEPFGRIGIRTTTGEPAPVDLRSRVHALHPDRMGSFVERMRARGHREEERA